MKGETIQFNPDQNLGYDRENPDIDNLDLRDTGMGTVYSFEGGKNKFKVHWHNVSMINSNALQEIRISFLNPKNIIKERKVFTPDQLQDAINCFYEYKKKVLEYDELK